MTLAHAWANAGKTFTNAYGPSETAVCSHLKELTTKSTRVTLGKPLDNVRAYVMDSRMRPVPPGVPGELVIGGVGVARGYHNRPGLTKSRFLQDAYRVHLPSNVKGTKLYRTGDLARWLFDGEVEFLGRVDFQVRACPDIHPIPNSHRSCCPTLAAKPTLHLSS